MSVVIATERLHQKQHQQQRQQQRELQAADPSGPVPPYSSAEH
jgi:hypothetical protein